MIFDPIANMISTIKNGYLAHKVEVTVPHSRYKESIAKVLVDENFVADIATKTDTKSSKKVLILTLKYDNKKPALDDIKQVSKAGLKVYVPYSKIPKVLGGLGTSVISTPQGLMSAKKARKLHVGGEIICHVW